VSKRSVFGWVVAIVAMTAVAPVFAQGEVAGAGAKASADVVAMWSIITAGFALGIAAGLAAIGQGRAVASATEAIARNPSAVGEIRGALLLGLVLIESVVIYVLLISLMLFFFNPFK
jgi:F-type H+-transporting ATPase subunit c